MAQVAVVLGRMGYSGQHTQLPGGGLSEVHDGKEEGEETFEFQAWGEQIILGRVRRGEKKVFEMRHHKSPMYPF